MTSGRQRREQIIAQRKERTARLAKLEREAQRKRWEVQGVLVNQSALAPNNSYGVPLFVTRGRYVDVPFRCVDCGKDEIWTPTQQKWWYEVAKGYVYSTATRCRACRRKAQAQRRESQRVHQEGVARKKAAQKRGG